MTANVIATCMEDGCDAVFRQVRQPDGFVEMVSESGERIENHEHNQWELSVTDA